jgi:2-polyprenyl-3-methyl-5-hydroxy-6-metoxy-1,4-benzoquinol methylase
MRTGVSQSLKGSTGRNRTATKPQVRPGEVRPSLASGLFAEIPCPLCGCGEADILVRSRYPAEVTRDQLLNIYRASSDHQLLDQMVRCRECSMVYLSPRPRTDIIVDAYVAAEDPVFVAQNPERIRTFRTSLSSVTELTGIEPKGRMLLDVGCGGGAFPKAAHDAGFSVTGIEPSHWLAGYGRREYGLDIRQGLLVPGLFDDESFDVVSLWDVIEHLTDVPGVLETIRSLLKPGGILLVNYPDYGSWAARILGRKWPFLLSVHLLYYTPATMTLQLQRCGFEVVHMKSHWQSLKLGYVLRRASPYFPLLGKLAAPLTDLGLAERRVSYNMGQTLVIARKPA